MGRYTGAHCRVCRRRGEKLYLKGERCHTAKCGVTKRPYAPGMHGQKRMRMKKLSDYGLRLQEKQKARYFYGMGERQFLKMFNVASKKTGMTGEVFLQLLESRLDNFLRRVGVARSYAHARQLVRHNHVKVNGQRVNIPSFTLNVNDEVTLADSSKKMLKQDLEQLNKKKFPEWFTYDASGGKLVYLRAPIREEIDIPIDEQLIVEFYSR